MKKIILLIACIFFSNIQFSQTTLAAGDIAIIQYNSRGNPEVIKFIALTNIESGTTINFTDKGWQTSTPVGFRSNEGVHTWVAATNIACGTIVTVSLTNSIGNIGLSADGDQILVYQGTLTSPVFIFAINNEGNGIWQADATSAQTSAIPPGLTNGTNAVAIQEVNNVIYSGSLAGNKTTVLSNICNKANWNSGNTATSNDTNDVSSILDFTDTFIATFTGGSWSLSGSEFVATIIDDSFDTSSDGNFETCTCTVNSGNTLNVNSGGTVTVAENIINNGTIFVESGGSVVQTSPNGINSGTNYTVQRNSVSQLEEGNYTYWSSPLSGSTLSEVANAQRYFAFIASSQTWAAQSSATLMTPGIGYINTGETSLEYPNNYTAVFSGSAFNNGNVNVTIGLGTATFAGADNNWNLLGNPYPSALDSELLTAGNTNLNGTIYYWTHSTADSAGDNLQSDYAMYNASGGTGGGARFIASGQGFFIQANAGGTATFTNSMRVSGNNNNFYKTRSKKSLNDEKDRIWLSLTSGNIKNQILIGFFEEATDNVDRLYDGLKLNSGASVNFYSILNDNQYGIQGKAALKTNEEISLGFESNIKGDFKISIDKFEGALKNSTIYLKDNLLGIQHNLKDSNYNFSVTETGEFDNRFQLIINTNNTILEVEENIFSNNILIENNINSFTVKSLDNTNIKKVVLYNLLGQEIFKTDVASSIIQIEKQNLKSNTVFILKTVLEDTRIVTNKIFNE